MEIDGLTVAEYAYDGFERRVKKVAGGVTVHYHYDLNGRLIAETDGAGNPIRDYVHIDGEPVAMQVYGAGAGWYWFLNDHLGTPQKLVDNAGAVVWQAAYMPFGEARILTADVENNLRFPGQYFDAETGFHYNWHRYYDPETGRYLRPDPIGLAGGINLFFYVFNNPINYFDFSGLDSDTKYLYQKVDKHGNHLKFGVTKSPETRYSKAQLKGGRLRILAKGPADHILYLERQLHKTLPLGPEEGQKAYYNIQRQKGLLNRLGGLGRTAGIFGNIVLLTNFYEAQKRADERGVDVWTILIEDMGVLFLDPNASSCNLPNN